MLNPQTINPFANMQIKASAFDPLPKGIYSADFGGVEPFSNDKVTDKLKWKWTIKTGVHNGREATAMTGQDLTPNTHTGRLLSGVIGRELVPGEDMLKIWDLVTCAIGKRYMVDFRPGPKNGKASVQSVSLQPESC